jgi:hypothetical protein
MQDRKGLYKMGKNRKSLAEMAQQLVTNNSELKPNALVLADFNDDLTTSNQADVILSLGFEIVALAYNMRAARGSEAMQAVVKVKGYIDYLASTGNGAAMAAKAQLDPYYDLPSQPDGVDEPANNEDK